MQAVGHVVGLELKVLQKIKLHHCKVAAFMLFKLTLRCSNWIVTVMNVVLVKDVC